MKAWPAVNKYKKCMRIKLENLPQMNCWFK